MASDDRFFVRLHLTVDICLLFYNLLFLAQIYRLESIVFI